MVNKQIMGRCDLGQGIVNKQIMGRCDLGARDGKQTNHGKV